MHQKLILLVEDDPIAMGTSSALLKSHNYQVDCAANGAEAMEKIKHNPDLIILDRYLPDMEGLEVCRKIRTDKRFRCIPIVILTARNTIAEKIEGLYVGADDYITKPFNSEELIARIDATLRRSRFAEQDQEDKEFLMSELNAIIDEKRIIPFFQPIVSLDTFAPLGFEVLSRPPQNSILSNPEFLFKVAMACGKYFQLELLCWEAGFKKWKSFGCPGKLFLNCIPSLIENNDFTCATLREHDIDSSRVVLELTERVSIQNYALFFTKINVLKTMGLEVAVDDVGSGFASLDTIAETKPNFVKIDMSLVRDIHRDELKQSIVEAIVNFCRKGKITTIAEGVEIKEELQHLIGMGVHAAQGYYLAKPSLTITG
ncbi:MAG: EAL domain-containing protein [Candidatus Omnitrophica bacterium]|jgi:FOG: EAL domain|nr:EAL domain-containing protein [Candidatus Omnitrophota bacterium]